MVGAAAAIALAESGYEVDVLEPELEHALSAEKPYDLRISAITADNIEVLKQLGVWADLQQQRHQAFYELAVREQGGEWVEFNDPDGAPLGFMLENCRLQFALQQRCQQHPRIHLHQERFAHIERLSRESSEDSGFAVVAESGTRFPYQALLGADGVQSPVRQALGLGTHGRSYHEHCLLALVRTADPQPARTWQTFAGEEIHALLPLAEQHACLIIYASHSVLKNLQAMPADVQQQEFEQRFFASIGGFQLLDMGSFPLRHQQVLTPWSDHYCGGVIGDAAHAVHPLAGQGVNLGFRDVQAIFTAARSINSGDICIGLQQALVRRQKENTLVGFGLDGIAQVFRTSHPGFSALRRLGLGILAANQGPIPRIRRWIGSIAGGRPLGK